METNNSTGFISDADVAASDASGFIPNTPQEQRAEDQQNIENQNKLSEIKQAKFGGTGNTLKAGALGVARGLIPLGISDLAAVNTGLTSPEELRGLQEVHPVASGLGQLTGTAALLGATGGAGAITEGMGTAAQLAGLGTEGAIFGAGNAVSDYAMGDPNLNAQKLLAHVGMGAALGVGLGSLGKVVETVLPKVYQGLKDSLSKLKGSTEDITLPSNTEVPTSWADKFTQGIESSKNPQGKIREFTSNLQDLTKSASKAATDMYEKMMPANLGESLSDIPTGISKNLASNTLNSIRSSILDTETDLLSPSFLKTIDNSLESVESSINKAKDSYDVHTVLRDLATDLDKGKIAKYYKQTAMTNPLDKDLAWKIRDIVRGDLKDPEIWGESANHYGQISDTYASYINARKDFASDFMKKVSGPFNSKNYVIDPAKVKSYFNNIEDVSKDLKKQHLNTFFDQADNISKMSENYKGFEQGADSISSHIQEVAKKNEQLSQLAKAISGKRTIDDSFMSSGPLAIGAKFLGIPGKVVGAVLGGVEGYKAITDPYRLGATLGPNFTKLQAAGNILNKINNKISSGTKDIFNNSTIKGSLENSVISMSNDEYDKHSKKIQELTQNPDIMMNHLEKSTKAINESMPNISTSIHKSLLDGLNFLNSKIPVNQDQKLLDSKLEPTQVQKAKFNNYYQIVNNPLNVLKEIKNGMLSNETLEALQIVHPELLTEMQQKVMENLNPKNIEKLNYSTKIALSKFINQPLSAAMKPIIINSNQMSLNSQPNVNTQVQKSKIEKSSVSGINKLNASSRAETIPESREKPTK